MLNLPLHHIGVATHDVAREERILSALGYVPCSEMFSDQTQGIRGRFMSASGQPTLELLENFNEKQMENGRLSGFLKRGIKIYHFAYATCSIETDTERLQREYKAKIIMPVMGAIFLKKSQLCHVA